GFPAANVLTSPQAKTDTEAAFNAADLGIAPGRCNVKAKTNEKLGFEGREDGIVAQAAVLIYRAEAAEQD
ncbi:2-C-methyl-D-erythritol 2,4-cyclodiphosphate synthase, partial [Ralstonia pseudosolanacearum]|uniref:2-C-methyl-D-erythritol 2,4-cyclodiphosphate synthase n=1 Tax=Ralstonia pseudosolanacearum TaxID=1310165 RepID=UPI003D16A97A